MKQPKKLTNLSIVKTYDSMTELRENALEQLTYDCNEIKKARLQRLANATKAKREFLYDLYMNKYYEKQP